MELVIKRLMLHDVLGGVVNSCDDQDNRQGAESRGGGIGAQGCRGESFFSDCLGINISVAICQVLRQGFHLHNFYQLCRGEVSATATY